MKLSIIVPVYNVELYLEECLDSLLKQSYYNFEMILVDDGSTDSSGEICDAYEKNYPNVKVIHQENQGLPFARNAGLEIACGEYIGFVDSDDVISEEMYEKLIHRLEETKADMAVCNLAVFNKKGIHAVSKRYKDKVHQYLDDAVSFYDFAMDSVWNKVYRHDVIRKHSLRFEDKRIVAQEDFWFLIRYCSHIEKIVSVSDVFYLYRERKSSITRSGSDKDITSRCVEFLSLADKYMKKAGRESAEFLGRMTYEMLFASINQMASPTVEKLRQIVKKFSKTSYYQEAISQRNFSCKSLKGIYDTLKLLLLRRKFFRLFSGLELLRVKRLRNNRNVEDQFV